MQTGQLGLEGGVTLWPSVAHHPGPPKYPAQWPGSHGWLLTTETEHRGGMPLLRNSTTHTGASRLPSYTWTEGVSCKNVTKLSFPLMIPLQAGNLSSEQILFTWCLLEANRTWLQDYISLLSPRFPLADSSSEPFMITGTSLSRASPVPPLGDLCSPPGEPGQGLGSALPSKPPVLPQPSLGPFLTSISVSLDLIITLTRSAQNRHLLFRFSRWCSLITDYPVSSLSIGISSWLNENWLRAWTYPEVSLWNMLLCTCLVAKSYPLCNPMDCSPPGSSVHVISQVRILEWVAISFSRGSPIPRVQTHISCIGSQILYQVTREALQRHKTTH